MSTETKVEALLLKVIKNEYRQDLFDRLQKCSEPPTAEEFEKVLDGFAEKVRNTEYFEELKQKYYQIKREERAAEKKERQARNIKRALDEEDKNTEQPEAKRPRIDTDDSFFSTSFFKPSPDTLVYKKDKISIALFVQNQAAVDSSRHADLREMINQITAALSALFEHQKKDLPILCHVLKTIINDALWETSSIENVLSTLQPPQAVGSAEHASIAEVLVEKIATLRALSEGETVFFEKHFSLFQESETTLEERTNFIEVAKKIFKLHIEGFIHLLEQESDKTSSSILPAEAQASCR